MDLKTFYTKQLDDSQRAQFCVLAVTTDAYMRVHLVHRRRIPRPELMTRLLAACQHFDSDITREQLLDFFYPASETPSSGVAEQVAA